MSDLPTDVINENPQQEIPTLTANQIIKTLDIAVLKPDATTQQVMEAAHAVESIEAASLCVASFNVALAKQITSRVTSVVGFPHGNVSSEIKFTEARAAVEDGATEIDVVINFGRFLEGRPVAVTQELIRLVQYTRPRRIPVKAILETCYYPPTQIIDACRRCVQCGVDWVKTSTGFGSGGATPWAVELMLKAVEGCAQVKASGGIKTYTDACMYLGMGCTRLGVGFTSYRGLLP